MGGLASHTRESLNAFTHLHVSEAIQVVTCLNSFVMKQIGSRTSKFFSVWAFGSRPILWLYRSFYSDRLCSRLAASSSDARAKSFKLNRVVGDVRHAGWDVGIGELGC